MIKVTYLKRDPDAFKYTRTRVFYRNKFEIAVYRIARIAATPRI